MLNRTVSINKKILARSGAFRRSPGKYYMANATTIPTPVITTGTAIDRGGDGDASSLSTLDRDIMRTHILSRLGGSALASVATTCSQLYALASEEDVWANLCHSTWPSTSSPRVSHVIRSFPQGSCSFFSDCCTLPRPIPTTRRKQHINLHRTKQLISAVDLYYGRQAILSRVVEIETVSDEFMSRPFRVNILEPEEAVEIRMRFPESEEGRRALARELRLSWIVIDASGRRAMNLARWDWPLLHWRQRSGEVMLWFLSQCC